MLKSIESRLTIVEERVKLIPELKDEFEKYVTQERFKPVEYIVYGLSGGILLTVLTSLLAGIIVVKQPEPKQVIFERPAYTQSYSPSSHGVKSDAKN